MLNQREEFEERQVPTYLSTEQLYRAHRTFVARFLTRLGVAPEALDDAVQEVFVTVHRRGGYVLGPAKPTSYLATIAINTAAAQRRSTRRSAARRGEQEPEDLAARGCDPGEVFETQQELSRLDRALAKLDPTLRDTLLAADGEGETCVAIADATSVPLGTVYWRLDRARKKFREALRVVDGRQRRHAGMVAAWLGGDWWRFGKKAGMGGTLGLGAVSLIAGLSLFGRGEPQQAALPSAKRAPLLGVHTASVLPEVLVEAPPTTEPVRAPSTELELTSHAPRPSTRTHHTRVSAPASVPVIASVAPVQEPPAAPRREPPAREVSETAQLARAEALLAEHPREALAVVRTLDGRESANYLREERDYIELMALLAIGDQKAGRARASAFLRAYPASAFARIVQARSGVR
ncbi:MAG: sigma-70 family RNA polymerase sigma factor [Polyangiales bacterium]